MTTDPNHETSADEVRRQLRSTKAEHDSTMRQWRGSLDELLDPEAGASAEAKASFLGVPNRRTFMFGGVVLAGGAVLAACGKKKTGQVAESGALPTVPASTTTTAPGSAANDKVLLRTAQSIEILAIDTYQKALDSGLLTDKSMKDLVALFQSQHQDHSNALADAIRTAGATPVTTANEYLASEVVDKAVAALTDQKSVLVLAREIENIAAQTYTEAGGVFSTPALRQSGMSIGEIEARHVTVLNLALGYAPVPLPLMPTSKAIDPKGFLKD